MSQQPRLTTIVVEKIERLEERWRQASADGIVCDGDRATINESFMRLISAASYADEAVHLGTMITRRGPDGERFRKQLRQRPPMPAHVLTDDVDDHVISIHSASDGNDPSAA